MALIETIAYISFKIRHLDNAEQAISYANTHRPFVENVLQEYDGLIQMLPQVNPDYLTIMPHTQALLAKIGSDQIPVIDQMAQDPKWTAQCPDAQRGLYTMMWRAGQNNEQDRLGQPRSYDKDETIYFGTRVKTPESYIVGIVGHAIERQILRTVTSADKPWQKDDYLHSANELVLLQNLQRHDSVLFAPFTTSVADGGLNWVNREYLAAFKKQYLSLR